MINNELFKTTINLIPNPIIITNTQELLQCNNDFLNLFAYEDLEHFNKYHKCICDLFVEHKDYFSLSKIDKNVLWTDYVYQQTQLNKKVITVSILDKSGDPLAFEITINTIAQYENHYIIVFTDVTPIIEEKKSIEKMAYYDPLTKIFNRQMFHTLLLKEKENQKRHGDALSLIMLDIDHFKAVNDTYGHSIGDKVLVTLTQLITKHLRTNDIFARWGGEEFLILMARTSATDAYNKANELRKIIEQYSDSVIPHFTVSFGVTEILDTDKEQSCFIRVDEALYLAKEKRNDVVQL